MINNILDQYKTISVLEKTKALLDWDLNVYMPEKGSEGRGEQMAVLTNYIADIWLNKNFKDAVLETDDSILSGEEKAMLRNLRRLGHYYFSIPKKLILEKVALTTTAFTVWHTAKINNDFASFAPYLKKIISLDQKIAEYLGYTENKYDALLNLYEPELTTKKLQEIFNPLQLFLTEFIKTLQTSIHYNKKHSLFIDNTYSIETQRALCHQVLSDLGYPATEGRLDTASHPFCVTVDRHDVRITTRFAEHDFRDSLTSTIHEAGHALYELGIHPKYTYTPLEGGVSMAVHESQSRFWENQVGRSREFVQYLTPLLKKHFKHINPTEDEILFALNDVRPDFIRTEADEVTYNLHIILRFQLEEQLINNTLSVEDLPEAWNKGMQSLLGITPPTDTQGVLQDIHWSTGAFGYFPTYALGNLYASQFVYSMSQKLPTAELVSKGEFVTILEWLRTNIHQYGSLLYPAELVQKVTGESLNSQYFISYIKEKYTALYKRK